MPEKTIKLPNPDHPITVTPAAAHIVVKVAGRTIADTKRALTLQEASYPPVLYIPREDADMSLLEGTDHESYCPYKGDCAYYSIPAGGPRSINAVWSYEHPHPAMQQIAGYLAFYPDRVDSIDVREVA